MIPENLRLRLVEKLLNVPLVEAGSGLAGRNALLAGIPHRFLYRNEGNAYGDMLLLVDQLAYIFGPNREWRLLQLVDNALPTVGGTELGAQLLQLKRELLQLQEEFRPIHVNPADVAQVHLFDLRQPVCICVGSLPATPAASGFVITTPTSRLLAYFCDRLKHRGAGDRVWNRDEVAALGPPLVIDPRHTTVTLAADKSAKAGALLAKKHVLWPVYVDNADDAAALWEQLRTTFGKPLEHHFVVTFGMPAGTDAPVGMTPLPTPRFTRQDIANWVAPIGKKLAWQQKEIDWWAGLIMTGCVGDPDDLPIELVYEQLEHHRGLITQHRDPDDLINALKDLEVWSLPKGLPWVTSTVP